MPIINTEEGCNIQEDLDDCKDWNNIQGMKCNSMKYKYSLGVILRVSVNL